MSGRNFDKQLFTFGEKNNVEELQKLVDKTSVTMIKESLKTKLGRSDCPIFWNYLLLSFAGSKSDELKEKRFSCVKCFLDGLLKVELSYKQTFDLVTRLCQDLHTFSSNQLIEILEHCIEGIRMGDPKCVGWKDLLPETLIVLTNTDYLNVNGVAMSGIEYRDATIRSLCTMRWPTEILTPIADMFKDLNLSPSETMTILNKFSCSLQSLSPSELPALAYQLFSICATAGQIIVPILSLEKYFYRFYYKKLFADMNSNTTDFDSIDAFSDKELREAEETILSHLSYCTQYKINEIQMCIVLRNFISMPDVILTPFILSATLSMTVINRDSDSSLSASVLLPFLRTVIRNNEYERILGESSVWCRDCLQRKQVDLEQTFAILIEQNKEGKDVITPGLVNLVFVLLKTKNNKTLNHIAMTFLTKFIRKRFIFGQGIIKKLAEWMVTEQDQYQYSECLTLLSVADTFTMSECTKTINYVLDFLLWIPAEEAMRMMSFIFPVLKISSIVRDALIDVLRKAIQSGDIKICRFGVYGFCMILKQLNNSNSQRSQLSASGHCTQQNISGLSLMSQSTLGNVSNPHRHFNMMTLEIIGLLRNCFQRTLEVKLTLYENLQRAVELNPKLVAHILQFIDWHFRPYFLAPRPVSDGDVDFNDIEFKIKFGKIVYTDGDNENQIVVHDNLGRIIQFISSCLVTFEKFGGDYNVKGIKHLLNLSVTKIITKEYQFEEISDNLTHYKKEMIAQQMNFIEGLMAFCILTSTQTNDNVKHLLPLFKQHQKIYESLKSLPNANSKKGSKKGKNSDETEASTITNVTINGVVAKRIDTIIENIWDLPVIEKFLRLVHENVVPFASPLNANPLRASCEFVRYLLQATAGKIEAIRLEPEYKQLRHSRRVLKYLTDITKVIYERCIKTLPTLWKSFDLKSSALAAECFQQSLVTANKVFKKNFEVFSSGFDLRVGNCKEASATLHDILDEFFSEDSTCKEDETMMKDVDGRRIPHALLQCLEILYDNISYGNRMTTESYAWLFKFCKENEVYTKGMGLVHKLLFVQRQKTHSGAFFNTIASHLRLVLGVICENEEEGKSTNEADNTLSNLPFQLKSITADSADSCLTYLYSALRKQIEDVDYFITKANNILYKYRIVSEDDRDLCQASLRSLERSICSQLVHISNALLILTNTCLPLGPCMDSVLRLLIQHYACLKNLTRHFINRYNFTQLTLQGTKFDLLLRAVGKALPTNVYALITYIEANIFDGQEQKKKFNPQAAKAKVLRETKLIPKIILCIENFSKHVILLEKKTKDCLTKFLHFGTVRDFRIKTSELKAAIDRTLTHSSQIEEDLSEEANEEQTEENTLLARMEAESAALDENRTSSLNERRYSTRSSRSTSGVQRPLVSDEGEENNENGENDKDGDADGDDTENEGNSTTPEDVLENESNQETNSQLLRNLEKINKKSRAKKRLLKEADIDVSSSPPSSKRRRRGRACKK